MIVADPPDEYPLLEFQSPFNCVDLFADRHVASGHGGKVAIITTAGAVTYAELARQQARFGQALLNLGVARGERVALLLPYSAEFFYLFMGAIRVGIIPVPLNTALGVGDYAHIIDDCG